MVIKTTKNKSAAGPDGISWRLLKMIAKTNLGRRIESDVALMDNGLRVPDSCGEMAMVMIPKPREHHAEVKGWRPIVLANKVEKWYAKIIAQDLGEQEYLGHQLSFAGRKQRGAIDLVMLMDQLRHETVYAKDIKSAFTSATDLVAS